MTCTRSSGTSLDASSARKRLGEMNASILRYSPRVRATIASAAPSALASAEPLMHLCGTTCTGALPTQRRHDRPSVKSVYAGQTIL